MTSDRQANLWRSSCRENIAFKSLDRSLTVNLVIIGGGFTGSSAALQAAREGASVCLLEAETIGHGGSGRNVGLVNAGLWLPPDNIKAAMGETEGMRLISALAQAPTRVFELIDRHHIDCEATRMGTLHCAHSPQGLKDLQNRHLQGIRTGAPLQLFDAVETRRRLGSQVFHGSLWDPRAGTIQPLSYCCGLARSASEAGATICEHSPVSEIKRENFHWVVTSGNFQVRAKAILVATNAYSLGIDAPFKPKFIPVSFSQFATVPMSVSDRETVLPGAEGCWDTALVMSSFRIDQAGRLILGGLGNLEGPGAAIHSTWARRKLQRLFPRLGHLPFEHSWRGVIAMTSDHIPKIVEFGPSAYACYGYSGRGIGPGTVFGTDCAKALLNQDPSELPLAPIPHYTERFTGVKAAYYESGAVLTHAILPSPISRQHKE